MFRFVGHQLMKVNFQPKIAGARQLWVPSCIQLNKSKAEEIAERKRRDQEMRWTKLYHFKDMKYHAIVTRMKIYPCLATICLTPAAFVLDTANLIPNFSYVPCAIIGITGTTIMCLYSKLLANTIGIIYICKDNKFIQIAYIDFFGKQHFIETTVDEVRQWEKSPVRFGLYKTVYVNTGSEQISLKIPWLKKDVFEMRLFRRLFGK